jgi:hypothetical protein
MSECNDLTNCVDQLKKGACVSDYYNHNSAYYKDRSLKFYGSFRMIMGSVKPNIIKIGVTILHSVSQRAHLSGCCLKKIQVNGMNSQ